MSVSTGSIVSRIYGNFRGVDFRGEEINLARSPDSLNVWKDYKHTESIRTRPCMKEHTAIPLVRGIFFYNGEMLVHSDRDLYSVKNGVITTLPECEMSRSGKPSQAFIFDNILYIKDDGHYYKYDGKKITDLTGKNGQDECYIPTTSIGRKPSGGGTVYEDVNMLSEYRKNTFLGDGESTNYYLDVMNIDSLYEPKIWVDGKEYTDPVIVDYAKGMIAFKSGAPPAPKTDGQDNVTIQFKKTVKNYRESISGCTLIQVFDNRVFFSGNPDFPNTVWHCSLNDPTYISDLDYYREGMDEAAVKGMVAGNNALWVFREPSASNTNVFYHTPTIDEQYGKVYPASHSSITIGCVGKAINFNDDIVFFSERGMEGISGDITTEQVAAHRSSLVDRKLITADYPNMLLEEWEGYLLVFIGNKVFLADSRTAFTNENHIEYEWFYWELEKAVTCTAVHEGVLYLGTEYGVYTLTDMEGSIESYWVTPKDKFRAAQKLKTTNKRGCVVEATGDVSVYAKVEDTDFELIGSYENVTDYFVSRIKRKKFKDIQLKFHSNTRFSLETATLECFIGGYIKR